MARFRIAQGTIILAVWLGFGFLSAFLLGAFVGGRGTIAMFDAALKLFGLAAVVHVIIVQFMTRKRVLLEMSLVALASAICVSVASFFWGNGVLATALIAFASFLLVFVASFGPTKISHRLVSPVTG